MVYDPKYNKTKFEYRRNKIKRISLDVQRDWYENELLPAVDHAGETVNGYIKKAVQDRIDDEQQ